MSPSIERLVENECLRVASIFGVDELKNRHMLIDTRFKDKFKESYECLGRNISVSFEDLSEHSKPCRLIVKGS